jgi:hypothetical protein
MSKQVSTLGERTCFGVGNVDKVCESCEENEKCQKVIRDNVCGIKKPPNTLSREAITEMFKKQCCDTEKAFTLKLGSDDCSPLRKQFAKEIGKKEALREVLSTVFCVREQELDSIEMEARFTSGL